MNGFVAIYRWTVPVDQEAAFRTRWSEATMVLRNDHGGLGSCLTRAENGDFVGIALWPSEASRRTAFSSTSSADPLPGVVRHDEQRLTVEDDLWLRSPFGGQENA